MDVDALCRKAAHDGQRYAALADVNALAGATAFVQACRAHGLRPVLGVDYRVREADRERRALLFARNADGYAALCRLLSLRVGESESRRNGETEKRRMGEDQQSPTPRLPDSLALLALSRLSENVLILTADASLLEALAPHAGDRLFALTFALDGPFHHQRMFDLAARLRLPLVAAHDVFFLKPNDYPVFKTLRAIATCSTTAFLPQEEAGHPDWYWTSRDWMLDRFASPAPVYALRQVLEQVELELDFASNKPAFFFPAEERVGEEKGSVGEGERGRRRAFDAQRHLEELAWQAFGARYPEATTDAGIEAGRRVERELEIIKGLGFAGYFLVAHDVVGYARSQGYHYLGRGSGANSFVAFLLGITQVNPLVLDLYFERFLNPARSKPPDFDLDFSWRDRDDVLAYLFRRYGAGHVALLSTHVTLRGRGALRQIGRTLGLPDAALSRYTKRLPSRLFDTFEELLAYYPEAGALDFQDETLRRLLEAARLLYGLPTHWGVHAGGVVITARPVTSYTALTLTPKGLPVTQLDMHGMEPWGLMKLDILSTRGLGTFTDALDLIRKEDPAIDAKVNDARVVLGDPAVRRTLREAQTLGLFYVESPGMRSLLRKLRVETFRELTAASSIIRPGVSSSGMMQTFVARHRAARGLPFRRSHAGEEPPDEELHALLAESHGVMIYQEDVLKVAHHWAGLTLAEADLLRRAMSGAARSSARIQTLATRFFDGCRARGRDEALAHEVWRQISSFAGYSFCKSHSASYAKLSMQQAYLKAHHPAAFIVSALRNGGGYYHPQVYVFEAQRLGVPVLLPCVLQSEREDGLVRHGGQQAIRLGLRRVHGLAEASIERIVAARRQGAFLSLDDVLARTGLGREEAETLIDVGAFDAFDGERAAVGAGRRRQAWTLHILLGKKRDWKAGTPPLFPAASPQRVLAALPPLPPYTHAEILHAEMTLLGLPVTYHPMQFAAAALAECGEAWVHSDAMRRHLGRRVRMVGWLMALKRITTRTGKRPMAYLTLYDGGPDLFEAVLFPPAYARLARHVHGCGPYVLEGRVTAEYEALTLDVHTLTPFTACAFAFQSATPWGGGRGSDARLNY